MTINPTFTIPTPEITIARQALARLQRHLDAVLDPRTESLLATDLAFAILGIEDIHPPYPPTAVVLEPSQDPAGDFATAISALLAASSQATTARETLRYAYVIRDLRAMESDPAFAIVLHGRSR